MWAINFGNNIVVYWECVPNVQIALLFLLLLQAPSKINKISYCILILSFLSTLTDIDDCTSHPCKNNGTCTDRVNGFNCSCAPGFNGTQCETGNYNQNYFILYHVLWGFNIFLSCLQCCIVSSNIVVILQWLVLLLQVLSNMPGY